MTKFLNLVFTSHILCLSMGMGSALETLKTQKRCMSAFKQQPHQMLLKQCLNDCQNDSQIVQKWS